MDCSLQWKEITCWDTAGRAAVTHEETMETAIPEYCPDLGRIVETAGQVQIRSRTADGKSITVSGAVRLTLLDGLGASIRFRSTSGSLHADHYNVSGENLVFGDGACRVRVDTTSGSLTVE